MSLPLTPDVLRAAYDYLNETEPFCNWNLPDGDDVNFSICRDNGHCGFFWMYKKRPQVRVSENCVGTTLALVSTVAHEMVHMHDKLVNPHSRSWCRHGRFFKACAEEVCHLHGFDLKLF